MVISIGFGRCGCRIVSNPLLESQKIFIDFDSLSVFPSARGIFHVNDSVVSNWFDVTVESEVSPSLIDSAINSIRRVSEKSDRTDTIQLFASPCGSSGGGLVSMLAESLTHEHSYNLQLSSLVFAHPKMIRPGQAINTLMTLGCLFDSVKSIFCFQNDKLLMSDFTHVNTVIAGSSESFSRFPEHIPTKFSSANFFTKKSNTDNVLVEMESVFGRKRVQLQDRPVAVYSGSPLVDGSLIKSVDSVFGSNPSGKGAAIQLHFEPSLISHGSHAIAFKEIGMEQKILCPLLARSEREKQSFVRSNHSEWFAETIEKLKLNFL